MGLECELKYTEVDFIQVRRALRAQGAECQGRYFEANLVFDREGRSLKRRGVLLRLRDKAGQAVLTVKHPPETAQPSSLKVSEELETSVDDFSTMRAALEALGFSVAFAYEKVREKWLLGECVICLDTLPFGDFLEIEGNEITVPACADTLGLSPATSTRKTYHALNFAHRAGLGLEPDENFVFDPAEKARLQVEIREEM